jgi:hypothetical protein
MVKLLISETLQKKDQRVLLSQETIEQLKSVLNIEEEN